MPKAKKDPIIDKINKEVGSDIAVRASNLPSVERVSSGIYSLDLALDGGFPCGPAVMLQGNRNTGKSSLCFRLAGEAESQFGKPAVIISSEQVEVQQDWMFACGVSQDALIVSEKRAEVALQIARDVLQAGIPSCVIIDSLAAMRPSDEFDKDLKESTSHGARAVLYNRFFNTLAGFIQRPPPLFLFTQHLYQNPRGHGGAYVSGGVGQQYIAKVIIRFDAPKAEASKVKTDKGETEIVPRIDVNWRLEKNHCGGKPDGTRGIFSLFREDDFFPAGTFSDYKYAIEAGWKAGLISPRGSWYNYKGENYHGEGRLVRALDIKECVDAYEASLASHRKRVRTGDGEETDESVSEEEND